MQSTITARGHLLFVYRVLCHIKVPEQNAGIVSLTTRR